MIACGNDIISEITSLQSLMLPR